MSVVFLCWIAHYIVLCFLSFIWQSQKIIPQKHAALKKLHFYICVFCYVVPLSIRTVFIITLALDIVKIKHVKAIWGYGIQRIEKRNLKKRSGWHIKSMLLLLWLTCWHWDWVSPLCLLETVQSPGHSKHLEPAAPQRHGRQETHRATPYCSAGRGTREGRRAMEAL